MIKKEQRIAGSKALVLGITFKENCPDIRNSRVIDIISELTEFGIEVDTYDPWADALEVREEYGIKLIGKEGLENGKTYDAIILAVAHEKFNELDINTLKKDSTIVYDVKGILPMEIVDERL